MTDRPILFSAPMVRALLAGTKTQTRRALRVQPPASTVRVSAFHHPDPRPMFYAWTRDGEPVADHPTAGAEISEWPPLPCPYGAAGDKLWVRESLRPWSKDPELMAYAATDERVSSDGYNYPTRCGDRVLTHVPSIHMKRCWSRITLEVTGVRVERLQAISEADAIAEGLERTTAGHWLPGPCDHPEWAYHQLWDQINGDGAWAANPWVWVVEFRRAAAALSGDAGGEG